VTTTVIKLQRKDRIDNKRNTINENKITKSSSAETVFVSSLLKCAALSASGFMKETTWKGEEG
jgi:hypothetical protein